MSIEFDISSGILERYFLGECSEAEAAQVEKMLQSNPDIYQEFLEIQQVLETVVFENAIQPNSNLKSQIWSQLNSENESSVEIKIDSNQKGKSISWLAYAATFTLLFSVSSLTIYFYSELNHSKSLMSSNLQKMKELNAQINQTKDSLNQIQQNLKLISDPKTIKVALNGVPNSQHAHAVVFWNPSEKAVVLTGIELPVSPKDKQYQLWALVDGVPVDAGVFNSTTENEMISMKSIEKSQAFAITLEPKGGSPTPHLETLCVIGNV